jgi:hypothetical protein
MTTDFSAADHHAMALAIDASRQALEAGDMPFGATLTDAQGRVLWVARNNQVSAQDCMGHAETVLVQEVQSPGPAGAAGRHGLCQRRALRHVQRRAVLGRRAPRGLCRHHPGHCPDPGPVLPVTAAQVLGPAAPAVTVQGGPQRDAAVQVQAKAQA